MKIKVLIADDIQILRQGLRAILMQDPDLEVAGLASNGKEAWELCGQVRPDVVLMDMRMPEYDGAYGIRRIKEDYPGIRTLVLTTFDDQETVDAAMDSGADGYILKEMEDDKVIQSVKAVHAGMRIFGESIFENIRRPGATARRGTDGQIPEFTPRERDMLRLVAQGFDNREIAAELFLAEGTVRNNISRLLEKLSLKDRTQLAVFAVKNDLDT